MTRKCGDCQACCTLLPVRELNKAANVRCAHAKFGKGCNVYHAKSFPISCALWTCRWLSDDPAPNLPRPDHAGYVVDVIPDYIRLKNADGTITTIEAVQIWCDPRRPTAYRDPALLAWLNQQAEKHNVVGLVRLSGQKAIALWPPALTGRDDYVEWDGDKMGQPEPEHHAADVLEVVAKLRQARGANVA